MAILLLIPLIVLFLFAFMMVVLYLVTGIRLYVSGKAEKSTVKLRSGKITIMNGIAWLALVATTAYFVLFDFFGLSTFL